MNKKVVSQFLIITFTIALVTLVVWAVFFSLGFDIENAPWLYSFVALCAFSPTIASYLTLKRQQKVSGIREWLGNVFNLKSPWYFYLLVVMLILAGFFPQIIMGNFENKQPIYLFLVMIPVGMIGGGIEEAGWSYVLRPELSKKFGYVFTAIIVALIWASWHIPVFLPQGRIESLPWFILFAFTCLGESFALGAIIKITRNVFLCVLFHTLANAVSISFLGESESVSGSIISTIILIAVSIIAVWIYDKKTARKTS